MFVPPGDIMIVATGFNPWKEGNSNEPPQGGGMMVSVRSSFIPFLKIDVALLKSSTGHT